MRLTLFQINGISITPVKSTDQGNAGGCQSTDQ